MTMPELSVGLFEGYPAMWTVHGGWIFIDGAWSPINPADLDQYAAVMTVEAFTKKYPNVGNPFTATPKP